MPVITGSNHDEFRLFVAEGFDYVGNPLTNAEYPAAVAALLMRPVVDPLTQTVLFLYLLTNYPPPPGVVSAPLALGAVGTDVIFACTGRNAALFLQQYVTTFAYEFNDENAPLSFGLPPASFPLGSYHSSEVQYLFNIFGVPAPFTSDQQRLSDTMIGYWTQFAKTSDPNSPGAPTWSPYSAATDQFQSFVPPTPSVESGFDTDHKCSSFWNTF